MKDFDMERSLMIREQLVARGIRSRALLHAMATIAREKYVGPQWQAMAYRDTPLPIECDQTISQPYIVAYMIEALDLQPTDRVLEIGSGSGYNAAVMSLMVKQVYSIERHRPLVEAARLRLQEQHLNNVEIRHGDGYLGWPEEAPFDAIIVTAAPSEMPQSLLDQLAPGGRLVAPVGQNQQRLIRYRKNNGEISHEVLLAVQFVPMLHELAD